LTAHLDLAAWKYNHSRAYRNVLLDAGHLSQTFQLCCTSESLNTWITGAFNDDAIEKKLNINGVNETVLFFVSAGKGNPVAFDKKMQEVVSEFN
jgi:SagB-type dehydrogenase family enzyme